MPTVLKRIGVGGIHRLPHRFREVVPTNVEIIKASMAEVGLINPITVRPCEGRGNGYWLIAGAHRLAAAKKLKWTGIDCIVVDGLSADEAELRAVDENLARPELTPAERARHVSYRKELYERLHPEAKHGATGRGRNRDAKSAPLSFVNDTAAKTGRSKRAVEQDATRGKRLGDDLERIAGTSLDKGTELDALAAMTPEERAPLIDAAVKGETVSAMREVVLAAAKDALSGRSRKRANRNPYYVKPREERRAWLHVYGTCRAFVEWATPENIALALAGKAEGGWDESQHENLVEIDRCMRVLENIRRAAFDQDCIGLAS